MPFKKVNVKQEIENKKKIDKEFKKAIELLEKLREEIQNCYGKDTELTEEISELIKNTSVLLNINNLLDEEDMQILKDMINKHKKEKLIYEVQNKCIKINYEYELYKYDLSDFYYINNINNPVYYFTKDTENYFVYDIKTKSFYQIDFDYIKKYFISKMK